MGFEWLKPAVIFGSLLYALIGVVVMTSGILNS